MAAFDFSIFMINFSKEYFAFFPGYVYFADSSQVNKTITEEWSLQVYSSKHSKT